MKKEKFIVSLLACAASFSMLVTLCVIGTLVYESSFFFSEVSVVDFLTDTEWSPLFLDKHFGILPLLCGTLLTGSIAVSIGFSAGVLIAIYLTQFAPTKTSTIIRPFIEILAGIPSIVFGYFALLILTPLLQKIFPSLSGFNALSPGLVMGIMIIPLVTTITEDTFRAIPSGLREASYALGASRLHTTFHVVIPAAQSGLIAALILSISRAIGETMVVTIAAGQQPIFTLNPLSSIETMTAYIIQVSLGDVPHGTLEFQTIFAVALALFVLTFFLNCLSILIREQFKKKYHV